MSQPYEKLLSLEEASRIADVNCRICGCKWQSKLSLSCPYCEPKLIKVKKHIQEELRTKQFALEELTTTVKVLEKLDAKIREIFPDPL